MARNTYWRVIHEEEERHRQETCELNSLLVVVQPIRHLIHPIQPLNRCQNGMINTVFRYMYVLDVLIGTLTDCQNARFIITQCTVPQIGFNWLHFQRNVCVLQ